MKKIFCILLAVMLIASTAIPAYAATPSYKIPDIPQVSKIKFNIKIELSEDFWHEYFNKNPIDWGTVFNTSATKELSKWKP